MPQENYLKVKIDGQEMDVKDIDISLSYKLEGTDDFQQKDSGKALNVTVPATISNDQISNTFHNPTVEDLTTSQRFKGPRKGIIEANGQELLNGKCFLKQGTHTARPKSYAYDFYGDNADWLIDLKESTLYDYLKDINFIFTKQQIIDSWSYDGTNPNLPYVFAPVRYALPMDDLNGIQDYDMKPEYMRPALSKYWIIYKAFKSLGYKIKSDFFDSPFFRRQVMLWTWGNFLTSPGTRLDNLDFLVKSSSEFKFKGDYLGFMNVHVDNKTTNGAFDNQGVYSWDDNLQTATWTYLQQYNYGLLNATFYLNIYFDSSVTAMSKIVTRVQWFKNGIKLDNGNDDGNGTELYTIQSKNNLSSKSYLGNREEWLTVQVNPGDKISFKLWTNMDDSEFGSARQTANVDTFELSYFKIPVGGLIDFSGFDNLKKYKFLDFLAGVVDEFNLCFKTDVAQKIVYLEPEHPYSLINSQVNKAGGYFNGKILNWEGRQDLSEDKESIIELFSDYERELNFYYREDDNDGTYKKMKDRVGGIPGLGKYVLPERFKAGKKDVENRFFSASMHYNVIQWKGLGNLLNDSPQMMCLIPENVSNTSSDEAQNTFMPKSAYYKGLSTDWGFVFDSAALPYYPYMFAVNYKTGGENDPILSYCDEQIGTYALKTVGVGLVRRFYLQRLAIMENGDYYHTWFRLNNNDIANFMHREHIICRGVRWEVIEINGYKPLQEQSTEVYLRKWVPIKNA